MAQKLGMVLGPTELTAGARSDRDIDPVLPNDWRAIPGPRGIDIVAPKAAFEPEMPDYGFEMQAWMDGGRKALATGFPATALACFREAYEGTTGEVECAEAMAQAYRALGREPLAIRAETYAKIHG